MNKFGLQFVGCVISTLVVQIGFGQTFVPNQIYQPQYSPAPSYSSAPQVIGTIEQYNTVPQSGTIQQYPSQPQYNTVPQYSTIPQYNSLPDQYQSYPPVENVVQPILQPAWTQELVDPELKEHDFGVVARASKQSHVFEFENTLGTDLYLTSIRASCGCTKPQILTSHVKAGETAKIDTVFDTLNFFGERGATVTLTLQKGETVLESGEIQFSVKGNIRRDVVLTPGDVRFDNVRVSEESRRSIRLQYAGNYRWKIEEVKSTNPNITVTVNEVERDPHIGRVVYDLVVNLNGKQPAGSINEFLNVVTNDEKTTGMPINVSAKVSPLIEASPVQLGVVNKGQSVKKKLILHSTEAFEIKEIKSLDSRIKFEPADGEKTLHILTYTLDTSVPGQISEDVSIVTSDQGQPEVKVPFSAQIVPATMVDSRN